MLWIKIRILDFSFFLKRISSIIIHLFFYTLSYISNIDFFFLKKIVGLYNWCLAQQYNPNRKYCKTLTQSSNGRYGSETSSCERRRRQRERGRGRGRGRRRRALVIRLGSRRRVGLVGFQGWQRSYGGEFRTQLEASQRSWRAALSPKYVDASTALKSEPEVRQSHSSFAFGGIFLLCAIYAIELSEKMENLMNF